MTTHSEVTSGIAEVPADFGHWLAGLIDGEGCFSIHPNGETAWAAHFYLNLRADDRPTLELIQRTTGLGTIYDRHTQGRRPASHKPGAQWMVFRKIEKLRLIALLERYPLRAKKARDFAIWAEAVRYIARYCGQGRGVRTDRVAHLAVQLRAVREYDGRDLIELPEPEPTLFDLEGSAA